MIASARAFENNGAAVEKDSQPHFRTLFEIG
jgi:hypothetical protein